MRRELRRCGTFLVLASTAWSLPTSAGAQPTRQPSAKAAAAPSFPGMRSFKVSFAARHVLGRPNRLRILRIMVLQLRRGDTVTVSCVRCRGNWRGPKPYFQRARGAQHFVKTPGLVVTGASLLDVSVTSDDSSHSRRYALRPLSGTLKLKSEWCGSPDHRSLLPCYGFAGPSLWSTVSACSSAAQPPSMVIHASIPALGAGSLAFVRYRLYSVDEPHVLRRIGLSKWHALGAANVPHEDEQTFTFPPGATGTFRGEADVLWQQGDRVAYDADLLTTSARVAPAGAPALGLSQETCVF